jgi:hypothetical protein
MFVKFIFVFLYRIALCFKVVICVNPIVASQQFKSQKAKGVVNIDFEHF